MSLDLAEIVRLSREQLAEWLWRRLHGLDSLSPLDSRDDDYWHLLFHDLYFSPEVDGDFRRSLRACVLAALEDALRFPDAQRWQEPSAVVELLMLTPDVVNDGTREDVLTAAQLLIEGHRRLPWRASWADGGELRFRLRGLTALVELRWDRIPPEQHPPGGHWESLWEPVAIHEDDPLYRYAGEQAALIFEGIEKTQRVETPKQPDRYKRLEAAFRWLGAARPWREKYLLSALKSILARRLLHQLPSAMVFSLIQHECCPLLADDNHRRQVLVTFADAVFPGSEPLVTPTWLAEAIEQTCSSVVVISKTDQHLEVVCEGSDRAFLDVLVGAAEETPPRYLNSPKYLSFDSIANFLRQHRSELKETTHPLHSRFDSFEQFTFDQLIAHKRQIGSV